MKNKNEIRNINIEISHMEKRDDVSDKLSGYAIVFNVLSEPIFDLFKERIMPKALEKTLKEEPHHGSQTNRRPQFFGRVCP